MNKKVVKDKRRSYVELIQVLYDQALSCIRDVKLERLRLSSTLHRGLFSMAKASKLDFVIEWFLL